MGTSFARGPFMLSWYEFGGPKLVMFWSNIWYSVVCSTYGQRAVTKVWFVATGKGAGANARGFTPAKGRTLFVSAYICMAKPHCFKLFVHCILRAASRAA